MEKVKIRIIGNYWAYACPRCDNGTMAWERDKVDAPRYLKCILCGRVVGDESFYKKSGEKSQKGNTFEAKPEDLGEELPPKKDYKWQFSHVQK